MDEDSERKMEEALPLSERGMGSAEVPDSPQKKHKKKKKKKKRTPTTSSQASESQDKMKRKTKKNGVEDENRQLESNMSVVAETARWQQPDEEQPLSPSSSKRQQRRSRSSLLPPHDHFHDIPPMDKEANYENDIDDDVSSQEEDERKKRVERVWLFLLVSCCCLLIIIALILMILLLGKDEDDSGLQQVITDDLPRSYDPDLGSETDDDFFYADEVLGAPGVVTTEMATYSDDCDYDNDSVVGFPNVWDQCQCDGEIIIIPDDVIEMRRLLIDKLLEPIIYDRETSSVVGGGNYSLGMNSCDPSNMALIWLASGGNRDEGYLRQRYILAYLFFLMRGPEWDYKNGWLTRLHECLWLGTQCNNWNVINSLALDTNNVFGTVRDVFKNCMKIISLDSHIMRMKIRIWWVFRSFCFRLTAALLSCLFNFLPRMCDCFSFHNQIPTEIAVLEGLAALSLSRNHLTGTIPTNIFDMPRLRELRLYGNRIVGTIPTAIGKASELEALLLYTNEMDGTIPTEIGLATSLTDLDISFNEFSEFIPTELGRLDQLSSLVLSSNQLSGAIPSELGILIGSGKLQQLVVSQNLLGGTIPTSFGGIPDQNNNNLEELNLANSGLGGPLPSELGRLTALSSLELVNGGYIGSIPTEYGRMTNLVDLEITSTNVEGTIPTQFGNLRKLEILRLSK